MVIGANVSRTVEGEGGGVAGGRVWQEREGVAGERGVAGEGGCDRRGRGVTGEEGCDRRGRVWQEREGVAGEGGCGRRGRVWQEREGCGRRRERGVAEGEGGTGERGVWQEREGCGRKGRGWVRIVGTKACVAGKWNAKGGGTSAQADVHTHPRCTPATLTSYHLRYYTSTCPPSLSRTCPVPCW